MSQTPDMTRRGRRTAARIAAGAVLLAAAFAVLAVLQPFSGDYTVRARFWDTGLLVKGNVVRIAGRNVGEVTAVRLTDQDVPEVELRLDGEFDPLPAGTNARVRLPSLSSPSGRYVELRIPESDGRGATIADGGLIPLDRTEGLVSVDQLFSMFDPKTRRGLTRAIRGAGTQFEDASDEIRDGYVYLNPALVGSRDLFAELNRDSDGLRRFIRGSSTLVDALAEREDDLAAVVDRLATVTGAIARESDDLTRVVDRAPDFMRRAIGTYGDLRATLDDLDPLVQASGRAAPRLSAVLDELRPFAAEARPTVRTLASAIRRPGTDNDLQEAAVLTPRLRDISVLTAERNGAQRPGSLPQLTDALRRLLPQAAFARPYSADATAFMKALGQVGVYDANGQASRAAILPAAFSAGPGGAPVPLVQFLRQAEYDRIAKKQPNRCPGAAERPAADGSAQGRPSPGFNCDPSQVPPGP